MLTHATTNPRGYKQSHFCFHSKSVISIISILLTCSVLLLRYSLIKSKQVSTCVAVCISISALYLVIIWMSLSCAYIPKAYSCSLITCLIYLMLVCCYCFITQPNHLHQSDWTLREGLFLLPNNAWFAGLKIIGISLVTVWAYLTRLWHAWFTF